MLKFTESSQDFFKLICNIASIRSIGTFSRAIFILKGIWGYLGVGGTKSQGRFLGTRALR